jgi:hypothetical protein
MKSLREVIKWEASGTIITSVGKCVIKPLFSSCPHEIININKTPYIWYRCEVQIIIFQTMIIPGFFTCANSSIACSRSHLSSSLLFSAT